MRCCTSLRQQLCWGHQITNKERSQKIKGVTKELQKNFAQLKDNIKNPVTVNTSDMEKMQTDDHAEIPSKDELLAEGEGVGSVEGDNPRGKAQGHSSGGTESMEDCDIDQKTLGLLKNLISQVEPMDRDLFKKLETVREQLELNFATLQHILLKHEDKTDKETDAVIVSRQESRPDADGKPTDLPQTSYLSMGLNYLGSFIGGVNPSESDDGNPRKNTSKRKLELGEITASVDEPLYKQCKEFHKTLKRQIQAPGAAKNSEEFLSIWRGFEWHLEMKYGSENIADDAGRESAGSNVDKQVVEGRDQRSKWSLTSEKPIKCVVHLKTSLDCDLHGVDQAFLASVKNQLLHNKPKLDLQVNGDDTNQYREGTSILVCPITSRLGSSVDSAMRKANCTGHPRLALVLFHHQPPHLPLSVESERLLTDDQYSGIGCMVDVVFWQNEGMYDCPNNRNATRKLISFILENSGVNLL